MPRQAITLLVLLVVIVAGALIYNQMQPKKVELTVVSWGGAYTKSQVEAYHKPWAAKTGNAIGSKLIQLHFKLQPK